MEFPPNNPLLKKICKFFLLLYLLVFLFIVLLKNVLPSLHSRHFLSFSRRRDLIRERASQQVKEHGWAEHRMGRSGKERVRRGTGWGGFFSSSQPLPLFLIFHSPLQCCCLHTFWEMPAIQATPPPSPCTNMQKRWYMSR